MIRPALRFSNRGGLAAGLPMDVVAFVGDSITNGASSGAGATNAMGYIYRGAAGYAAAACGHAWRAARNPWAMNSAPMTDLDFGYDGATSAELLTSRTLINTKSGGVYATTLTVAEAVLASGAGTVVIHAGTNDLNQATAATTLASLTALATYFRRAGRRVFLCSLLPRGGNTAGPTVETFQSRVNAVNAALPAVAAALGCVYVDWHGGLMSGGAADAACFYENPAVHPNATGAARMGLRLAEKMAPYLGSPFAVPAKGSAAWLNADANLPYMGTDSDSNGLADGVAPYYFDTQSAALENNGDATWQRIAETGAVETVHHVFAPAPSATRVAAAAGTAATFRATCRYEILSGTLGGIGLRSRVWAAGYGSVLYTAFQFTDSEYSPVFPRHSGVLLTEPFAIPAGGAICDSLFLFYGSGAVRLTAFGVFESP